MNSNYRVKKILNQNHSVGNHTFNHLNGWKTDQEGYLKNIYLCQETIKNQVESYLIPHISYLQFFRPPYGRITRLQAKEVLKTNAKNVCGIKIFMGSSTGDMLVDNEVALKNIFSKSPMLIATHCEDEATIRKNLADYKEKYGDDFFEAI